MLPAQAGKFGFLPNQRVYCTKETGADAESPTPAGHPLILRILNFLMDPHDDA